VSRDCELLAGPQPWIMSAVRQARGRHRATLPRATMLADGRANHGSFCWSRPARAHSMTTAFEEGSPSLSEHGLYGPT